MLNVCPSLPCAMSALKFTPYFLLNLKRRPAPPAGRMFWKLNCPTLGATSPNPTNAVRPGRQGKESRYSAWVATMYQNGLLTASDDRGRILADAAQMNVKIQRAEDLVPSHISVRTPKQRSPSMGRMPTPSIRQTNRRSWRSPCLKHLSGTSKENRPSERCKYCATITPRAWSAYRDFAEGSAGAKVRLCFKVPKSSRTARLRRRGSWCRDRGPAIFRAARRKAVSGAISEKDRMDHWIIGLSNHALSDVIYSPVNSRSRSFSSE